MNERYGKQSMRPDIGPAGQRRLGQGRVLCVSAGGLGCSALPYLPGAGSGLIGKLWMRYARDAKGGVLSTSQRSDCPSWSGRAEAITPQGASARLAEGLSDEDLERVALLAIPTISFPRAAAAFSWLDDETNTDETG